MPAGRPSNYEPVMVKTAEQYLNGGYKKDESIPTIAGLALKLRIPRQKVYEYANDDRPEFRDIVEDIKALQEKVTLKGSLTNKFNAKISALILAKHGYKEQIGLSGEGEGEAIKIDTNVAGAIGKIYGSGESSKDGV